MATLPGGLATQDFPSTEASFASAGEYQSLVTSSGTVFQGKPGYIVRSSGDAAAILLTYYLMRADDGNCPGTPRQWIVAGTPDWVGVDYGGAYCGGSPVLNDIHIALEWQVSVT